MCCLTAMLWGVPICNVMVGANFSPFPSFEVGNNQPTDLSIRLSFCNINAVFTSLCNKNAAFESMADKQNICNTKVFQFLNLFHLNCLHLNTVQPISSTFLDGLHSSKSLGLKCARIFIVLIWCSFVNIGWCIVLLGGSHC